MNYKKVMAGCLLTTMVLTACGGGKKESVSSTTSSKQMEATKSTKTKEKTKSEEKEKTESEEQKSGKYQKSEILPRTFQVPLQKIVVDVPNYQSVEEGYTQVYILHEKLYIAFTANIDFENQTQMSAKEAHEKTFSKYVKNIGHYDYVNRLDIKDSSEETINGIKVYKFEGTVNSALDPVERSKSYDEYAIGYSFVMDGVPCEIIGVVQDRDQPEADKKQVKTIVEEMMKTVRSAK